MFDIGWQEIFIIAIVAVLVIGPKDLPRTLKMVMAAVRKVKGMAREFQSGIDDLVRESELDDMRKQIEASTDGDFAKTIEDHLDPDGSLTKEIKDLGDVEGDLNDAAKDFSDDIRKSGEEAVKPVENAGEAVTEAVSESVSDSAQVEPAKVEAAPIESAESEPAGDPEKSAKE